MFSLTLRAVCAGWRRKNCCWNTLKRTKWDDREPLLGIMEPQAKNVLWSTVTSHQNLYLFVEMAQLALPSTKWPPIGNCDVKWERAGRGDEGGGHEPQRLVHKVPDWSSSLLCLDPESQSSWTAPINFCWAACRFPVAHCVLKSNHSLARWAGSDRAGIFSFNGRAVFIGTALPHLNNL